MSMPLYHYVLPVTIFESARGAKYGEDVIKMPTKRWDTLAWFQVILNKGDFEKSFNLGSITGGFGTPSSGSSRAAAKSVDEPATIRKSGPKKLEPRIEPIVNMSTYLAEYMALNATKTSLAATMEKLSSKDNETNNTIMTAIDYRREQLAQIMKPAP
jgi:hypothetical protein